MMRRYSFFIVFFAALTSLAGWSSWMDWPRSSLSGEHRQLAGRRELTRMEVIDTLRYFRFESKPGPRGCDVTWAVGVKDPVAGLRFELDLLEVDEINQENRLPSSEPEFLSEPLEVEPIFSNSN